jgi:hypothetical protein
MALAGGLQRASRRTDEQIAQAARLRWLYRHQLADAAEARSVAVEPQDPVRGAGNVHVLAGPVISTSRCPARISGIRHHVAADRRGGSGGMDPDCLDLAIAGAIRRGLCGDASRQPRWSTTGFR